MSKRKNLVYFTVYGKKDYIKLFNLLFISLVLAKSGRNQFTLLIMTAPSFKKEIYETVSAIKTINEILIWANDEKPEIFDAAFARYQVFAFSQIHEYEKILYLDTDILINGPLSDVFDNELLDGKMYCLPEGELEQDSVDFYGRSLFIELGYEHCLSKAGFTSGVILFKNNQTVKNIFEEVLALGYRDKEAGRIFYCFDQPYLNLLATSRELIDLKLLPKYMVNNPVSLRDGYLINHFPGGPGNFGSKFSKMSKCLLEIMRYRMPVHLRRPVFRRLFSYDPAFNTNITRLGDHIFLAELVDGTTGFLLTNADFKAGLMIAVPSFEVSVIKLDVDVADLEVPVANGHKVIDEDFLDRIAPGKANNRVDINARQQIRDNIDSAVLKFIQFSYANEQSLMWGGGTVDGTEFSALTALAQEASAFHGPIIEIGTLFGFSTNALAIGKASHIPLITVDTFTWNPIGMPNWRHEELTRKGLAYLVAKQNVRLVKSTADSFYQLYDGGQPSLVFIDADHSYEAVRKDIDFAERVGAKIICGDDFSWPGVRKAVEESFGQDYQTIGDMWVFRRAGQRTQERAVNNFREVLALADAEHSRMRFEVASTLKSEAINLLLIRNKALSDVSVQSRRLFLSKKINSELEGRVKYGLFKGLRLENVTSWGGFERGAMLLGLYEQELLQSLMQVPKRYKTFINIGAADGYYAIGVLVAGLFERSICYEMSESGQSLIRLNASLNGVADRIILRGVAQQDFHHELSQADADESVLLVDIEGGEFDLFSDGIPEKFRRSVIFVEIHEKWMSDGLGKLEMLENSVQSYFRITVLTTSARDLSQYKELDNMNDTDRWLLCSEGRPYRMRWWRLDPL